MLLSVRRRTSGFMVLYRIWSDISSGDSLIIDEADLSCVSEQELFSSHAAYAFSSDELGVFGVGVIKGPFFGKEASALVEDT